MSKKKSKVKIKDAEKITSVNEFKEYGVVLKKQRRFRHRIYPQKGKIPEEDNESYKIV